MRVLYGLQPFSRSYANFKRCVQLGPVHDSPSLMASCVNIWGWIYSSRCNYSEIDLTVAIGPSKNMKVLFLAYMHIRDLRGFVAKWFCSGRHKSREKIPSKNGERKKNCLWIFHLFSTGYWELVACSFIYLYLFFFSFPTHSLIHSPPPVQASAWVSAIT